MSNWLVFLIRQMLAAVSGPLRDTLVTFAKNFRERARKTENPWDDLLADVICSLLEVDK